MTAKSEPLDHSSMSQSENLIAGLGVSCMVAAILSGVLKGVWEILNPILDGSQAFEFAPPSQLWGYGLLEVVKSAGFLAGLFGFYLTATKRGALVNVLMGLAVLGGIFFAIVWMAMAASARFTMIYVLGGVWFQVVAPIALGIAALFARRISWLQSILAIMVGILNAQIFSLLGPGRGMLAQGVIWLAFGYIVYGLRRHA